MRSFWLLIVLLVPSFGMTEEGVRPSSSIKIGGIFDLSSDAGDVWGTAERNAFLLAIKDFEAANPALRVEPIIEDSAYSNSKSVSAFQKLTAVDGVRYIVGPTWEMFVATMPLCERKRIICMAPSNNSREFDNPALRYSFSAYFREDGYSDVIADELNARGFKRSAVFAAISPYHDPQVENLLSKLKTKPAVVNRVLPDLRDFRSLITRLPPSTDSIAVFLLNDGQLFPFLKQLHVAKRFAVPLFTDDSPIFDPALEQIKELKFDIRYSHQFFPSEVKRAWESKYRAAYGRTPEAPSASVCYDETKILLGCIRANTDVESVRDCVARTDGFLGTSGVVSFRGKQTSEDRKFELTKLE